MRIVEVYIEPQKLECSWQGFFMISRTWWFSPRVIRALAVGHEMWCWLAWTNSLSLCKTLKGINHTKAKDASVIFQRITLLLVSQATSKVRKCLLNLWSTWHKYISLTETTSIRCFQIYLIQLYFINVASQLLGPLIRHVSWIFLVLLPHRYKDLLSCLLWRGHFWHPIWIFWHILHIGSPLAIFAKIASLQRATFVI